jgi:hypothetical protein
MPDVVFSDLPCLDEIGLGSNDINEQVWIAVTLEFYRGL